MKAPDKIYLHPDIGEKKFIRPWLENPFNDNSVCYIRKDALLEWLDGKLTIEGATEGIVGGYDLALKDVIKHIESL